MEKSDNKTFDLKVSGKYAEVKTKNKPFNKLDFVSLTNNQYGSIEEDFKIFLVCNVGDVSNVEFYEFSSRDLLSIIPKKIVSYEYNKGDLYKIKKINL